MESNKVVNLPNAGKVIEALRHVGYENIAAIADLVDNAIDAKATAIYVQIKPSRNDYEIFIADNGTGMDKNTLDEALKLGSETEHYGDSDLGKFGMGLVTASLSIARRLTVITKRKDNTELLTSIQDIDEVIEKNEFIKELRIATSEEQSLFRALLGGSSSGTLVILSKCDQIQNKNIDLLHKQAEKELGQIFRLFIQSKREIFVAGHKIAALDPLMLESKGTKVLSDEAFEIKTTQGTEKVRLKMVLLPKGEATDTGATNITNQGFYVMRNNREIAAGVTLNAFQKHNDYNRFRAEIHFSNALDREMRVEFTKRDLKPKEIILDEIMKLTKHQLEYIRKEAKREQTRDKSQEETHEESAKSISEKSNLLIRPEVEIEKRSPKTQTGVSAKPGTGESLRRPQSTHNVKSAQSDVQFEVREMGVNGQLFDVDQIGKTTIITYNSDHPFYQKVFIENGDNNVKQYVDFMVFSLATARQVVFDDNLLAQIDSYMTIFSSNLRVLMR